MEACSCTAVVADDHPMFRGALVDTLVRDGIDVLAAAADGAGALELISAHAPDVAVLDRMMPGTGLPAISEAIGAAGLPTRVLVVSAFAEGPDIIELVESGIDGYMLKTAPGEDLVAAVRSVAAGQSVFPPEVQAAMTAELRSRGVRRRAMLTERESEVLGLMSKGLTAERIASELFVSPSTVRTHVRHIYDKLEVNDKGSAIAEAMRRGLLR